MFEFDFIALLPEIFLINTTIILLVFGVIFSSETETLAFTQILTKPKKVSAIPLGMQDINIENFDPSFRLAALRAERSEVSLEERADQPGTNDFLGRRGESSNIVQRAHQSIVHTVAWLGFLCILFTILLCAFGPIATANLCYNNLIIDNFTFYLKLGLLISVGCILLMSFQYFQQEDRHGSAAFESIILINMSTCSMLFMISAFDLITMYLAIELQSLCFYVLAASKRNSEFSTEAGLKYFILGAFSSGILLFGCSLIYGFTGVTNLEELAKIFTTQLGSVPIGTSITDLNLVFEKLGPGEPQFSTNITYDDATTRFRSEQILNKAPLGPEGQPVFDPIGGGLNFAPSSGVFMGILFLAVGFLFKITAVPFHMWAPDVYEGSPTLITAFFSTAPKIAILANMLRVFIYSFYDPIWQQLFVFCSIASMVVGAFAALSQNKVKRLLAFSSIGHVGYLLIGFSCGTIEGIQSLLIGLFIYVFMTINIFAAILSLRPEGAQQVFGSSGSWLFLGKPFKYVSDLGALAKTNPLLALTICVTMFSFAGIPPLAGFCSKFFLFFAALSCGAYLVALIGIVTSVISCFYYIRLVKIMYFDTPKTWILYKPMDREKSILLGITIFFITFFFLYPSPLFLITHKMALSLCV